MGAVRKRVLKATQVIDYTPLPGFYERAPGVWIPQGYRPSKWEDPTPIVRDADEAAVEYMRCANDLPHFAFSACWALHTDDPSGEPTYRKFPTYPYLIDFFTRTQQPSNLHIEKSRQLLMSWAWMCVFLWDILFHDAWANLAISRKEVLVDDGAWHSTQDSLFGKLRIIWSSLPPYLQHPLQFRHLRVLCTTTGSYVKGESGATGGGRGATYKRALIDEAAHVPRSETMFRAVHEAAKKGLVLNSTPLGKGNVFARIRFQPRTSFRRLSYHWSMHPEKAVGIYCECGWKADPSVPQSVKTWRHQFDEHVCPPAADPNDAPRRHPRSAWYDAATADYTPEQIASEFDLSYEKSMRGRVFEPFDETRHVREYMDLRQKDSAALLGPRGDRESQVAYRRRYLRAVLDPRLETVCGWDFGVGDPTSLVLGQVVDEATMKIRWLDEYERNNASYDHYHKFVQGLWAPVVKEVTKLDILHYGDPSGKNRDSKLESWVSNLALSSPPIVIIHTPHIGEIDEWLDFVANIIRKGHFEVMLWCAHLIDALGQYHFPLDGEGNPVPGRHLPVHDEWSHSMSALRYVYQFRWAHRLKDVHAKAVSASAILSAGAEDRPEQPPANW